MARSARVEGLIDEIVVLGGLFVLRGWARDSRSGAPATRIMVFVDGRLVRTGRPWFNRPDLAGMPGGSGAACGFAIEIPRAVLADVRRRITVVAEIEPDFSGEIGWGPGAFPLI